jgi:aspartyl-tRNA(Asn)/glutamyl-tRNA(Gln) amidotransferase subunit C
LSVPVSPPDVLHVARLARLHLSEHEVALFTEQLNSILAHVADLGHVVQLATDSVSTIVEEPAPQRADAAGADALAFSADVLSPHFQDGFFTVPRLAALDSEAE